MEIIGLLNQSAKAKKETDVGSEREQISLAYTSVLMKKATTGSLENRVEATELEDEINDTYGANTVTVTENDDGTLKVVYEDSKRAYKVKNDGKTDSSVNYEEIFKTATKHPDQEDTNDIGIAEDGSVVNLDLWLYVLNSDGTSYCLNSQEYSRGGAGYSNLDIVDGRIQGKVPMYIKEEGGSNFFPVTRMVETFYSCTNLTTAPEIPSSVTYMGYTFCGCTNLTGELIINANPTYIGCCLYNAVTGPDCSLVLKGECPREKLIEIALTEGSGSTMPSNITIGK